MIVATYSAQPEIFSAEGEKDNVVGLGFSICNLHLKKNNVEEKPFIQ